VKLLFFNTHFSLLYPKEKRIHPDVLRLPASSKKQYEAFMLRKSAASPAMSIPKDRKVIMRKPWKSPTTLLNSCRRKVQASFDLVFALQLLYKELLALSELHFFHKNSFPLYQNALDQTKCPASVSRFPK